MRIFSTLLLFICLFPGAASAWWNKDWDYRKEFIIDTSATGLAIENTVNESAILIRLHLGNFTYFNDTLPNGEDIRFMMGDDITPLKHHIEFYNPTQQVGLIWVKLPRLIPGTNLEKIYMYYGNENAAKGEDPAGTYSVDDVLVYHFDGAPSDKTAYNNHPQSNTSEEYPTATIGSGVSFNGENNIVIPSSPSLRLLPDPGNTVSFWLRTESEQDNAAVMTYIGEEGQTLGLNINGLIPSIKYTTSSDSVSSLTDDSPTLTPETWHHITFTITEEKISLYLDGQEIGVIDTSVTEMGGIISVGSLDDGAQGFIGQIDELRILKSAVPYDWILVSSNNQGSNSVLLRAGADGQQEGAGEGHNYVAFSLSKLTLEGKITTGILTVMLVFAVLIMIGKSMFLGKVRKANRIFSNRYSGDDKSDQSSSSALIATYKKVSVDDKKLKESVLNRVFKVGMKELHARLTASTAGAQRARTLSTNTVNAIRASMDTAMLRENQRLQKQMVLLTIAIAGGPFIGLFGTVMGVMITFAEVALAGNVDVNAIAPGISAALVATVAGLAVAIPALFGYNYLASQIKEISADMRVFVDEFQARVAEEFGD